MAASTPRAIAGEFDTSLENIFPDEPGTTQAIGRISPRSGSRPPARDRSPAGADGSISRRSRSPRGTLRDHVGEQISFAFADPAARLIAADLADGLDEAGYLRADLGEIAERLGAPESDVRAVLAVCQTFDPAGLFARDLAECLALQLKARDRFDPAMAALVANLDLLARAISWRCAGSAASTRKIWST